MPNNLQKAFLKWVGGKGQIINKITEHFPSEINNYHEIFLGGGTVLFAILSLEKQNKIKINGKIYAYDLNDKLINCYKNIQNNKDEVFDYISGYMNVYSNLTGEIINRKPQNLIEAKTSKESYYYWLRRSFNSITDKTSSEHAALFILLNKLGFRGVYREGPNGFNVPYGHYKKTPTVITKVELQKIYELIKDVEFIHLGFEESMDRIESGDLTYLDPPYAPENATSFVGYTTDGFNLEKHETLFSKTKELNDKEIKFIMSNSNVELVTNSFSDPQFNINVLEARRAIHCKKPQSKTTEVIISNFD